MNPSKNNKGYKTKHHHHAKKLVSDSFNQQHMVAFIGDSGDGSRGG